MDWILNIMDALSDYTKAELETGLKRRVIKFISEQKTFLNEQGLENFEFFLTLKKYNKSQLLQFCSIPFLTKEIFQVFFQSIPNDHQVLFKELIYTKSLNSDEIKEKFNIDITEKEGTGTSWYEYDSPRIKKEFNVFKELRVWSYDRSPAQIYLPAELREILIDYHDFPEEAILKPVDSPNPTEYVYEAGEENILQELARLIAYQQQGQIKLTSKDRPVHSTISKMNRSLNIKEFFAGNKDKLFKNIRTQLLAYLIVYTTKKDIQLPVPKLIMKLIINVFQENVDSPAMLLSHLKGMGYLDSGDFGDYEPDLLRMLSTFPLGEWMDINNIKEHVKYSILDLEPIFSYSQDKLHFQFSDSGSYTSQHSVRNYSYSKVIAEPFIKGFFFFFASWGLVDIAYDLPTDPKVLGKTYFSPYDGLKYVRLTPLGAYVLGQVSEYEFSGGRKHSLVLSSDALIITADVDDNTADVILAPYSRKITPHRYLVENKIFLKNIRNKKELKNRIDLFKQSLEINEYPDNWNHFFKDLELKIDSLVEVENVKVFKIPEENEPLRRMIIKDPVLKNLVLKAEGFHLILFEKNAAKFRKRLQELGYLLT